MKVSELSGKANLTLKLLQKHYSLKDWPREILGMLPILKSRHYVTSNQKNRAHFHPECPGPGCLAFLLSTPTFLTQHTSTRSTFSGAGRHKAIHISTAYLGTLLIERTLSHASWIVCHHRKRTKVKSRIIDKQKQLPVTYWNFLFCLKTKYKWWWSLNLLCWNLPAYALWNSGLYIQSSKSMLALHYGTITVTMVIAINSLCCVSRRAACARNNANRKKNNS